MPSLPVVLARQPGSQAGNVVFYGFWRVYLLCSIALLIVFFMLFPRGVIGRKPGGGAKRGGRKGEKEERRTEKEKEKKRTGG